MPTKATFQCSDSQNPSAAEMPLYAVILPNGQFQIVPPEDIEDTPRYTLTPAAIEELAK